MKITAAVVRKRAGDFAIEELDLCDPRDDEMLVEVVASGMCQTDLHGRDGYYKTPYPAVFGHEGVGIVRAVGKTVTEFAPGDHVVMSYPWCGTCPNCQSARQSYCVDAFPLKMRGKRADGSTLLAKDGKPVYSAFFQQSSFANYTIANERWAVKVRSDAPLELLGSLACGGQTGAGAVLNVLMPKTGDGIAIFGVGAVGLSALMAAKIAGCDPIVAVDVHKRRLKLATSLGATHTFNHDGRAEVVSDIRKAVGGLRYAIETTANPYVLREGLEVLMPAGTCILLGSARNGTEAIIETPFLQNGRTLRGVIQGDSVPQLFIPQLVDHLMAGRFPVDTLVKRYKLSDINKAAEESSNGKTIKPVIRMPH